MRERKFGRIFNLTGSTEPPAHLNAGVPPNGAVRLWAKALSRVVGGDGVTVNCISPGRIRSEAVDTLSLPDGGSQTAMGSREHSRRLHWRARRPRRPGCVSQLAESSLHHRATNHGRRRRSPRYAMMRVREEGEIAAY